jgi:golgi-specific brefeldin A-resistance guanine nucleotide exchange factor 1
MIYQLTRRIPILINQSHLEANEGWSRSDLCCMQHTAKDSVAWSAYWSPIFQAVTHQCLNPCREIRTQAFSVLQRTLLSEDLASGEHKQWTAIFGEVLFPLIKQLLKPEVFKSDPVGMSETRVRAAALLCKVYLHYLVALAEWHGLVELWTGILDIMDRLMNSGQGDNLVSITLFFLVDHSLLHLLIALFRRKQYLKT